MRSLTAQLESVVGAPVRLELLAQASEGPSTYRARGTARTAVVKVYEGEGSRAAAGRIGSLADGPYEPRIPEVWAVTDTLVVLSDLTGRTLRAAALAGDEIACERVGAVLGFWHWHWRNRAPEVLAPHTLARELDGLRAYAERAPEQLAAAVMFGVRSVEDDVEWPAATVVHRRLSEETIVLGHEVGLVDLEDVALGPPELDVGNLCGHFEFLARRYGRNLDGVQRAFLNGYLSTGAPLGLRLLLTCRSLTLLRLGCLHRDAELATMHAGSAWPPPPDLASAG